MCEYKKEKILDKIKKVFELSKNNPSEKEAKAAALKAQQLMVEYHLSIEDIENIEDTNDITEIHVHVKTGNKWKSALAWVISNNFRCKYFYSGKSLIVFYGYRTDAEIAAETFKFLFDFGNKKATNYYNFIKRQGKNTKGIRNAFLIGYLEGIKEVLEKQSTALMVITPKEVINNFELMIQENDNFSRKTSSGLKVRVDSTGENANKEGKRTGKAIIQSRSLECMA